MDDPLVVFMVWILSAGLCGLIGAAFGSKINRPEAGFLLGLFFGPIGWIIIFALGDHRPKCPECKGSVIEGATKCLHCGSSLLSKETPCPSEPFVPVCIEGAVVKGNGDLLGIAIVGPDVLSDDLRAESYREWLRDTFSEFASPRQIILAQREPTGAVTYQGRSDLVGLLADTDPDRIPWRKIVSTTTVSAALQLP